LTSLEREKNLAQPTPNAANEERTEKENGKGKNKNKIK